MYTNPLCTFYKALCKLKMLVSWYVSYQLVLYKRRNSRGRQGDVAYA